MTENQLKSVKPPIHLPISERRLLLVLGDLVAVNAATLIALRIWTIVGEIAFDVVFVLSQSYWFVLLSLLWLILASANNFYDLALTARWARSQARLLQIEIQLLFVYLLIFFLSPRDALPRLFILYYAVGSYILIAAWRLYRPFLIGWRPQRQRVLVAGMGWPAQTIIEAIQENVPDDYEVVGIVDEGLPSQLDDIVVDAEVIGPAEELVEIVRRLRVSEVILATASGTVDGVLFQAVMDCYELGVPIRPMPLLYEQITNRVPVEHVGEQWNVVLPLEGRSPFDPYPGLKRLIDIAISLMGLVCFGLLLPLIALAIVLDSPGPIFYRQERVGKAGRVFKVIKLRSMIPDAEASQGPIWAVSGDSRITRVGRFLRKSRLDEIPQLLNVLRGEMSMVGPRPERPHFVERLQRTIPFYRTRLSVLPGLTGWAQISYGYGSTERDALIKLQYDLYYIRHRSVLLDGLIMLRTVGKVVRLQGT
ncbi:MAG: sugar transferase [Anaerolineae bacterium]|nr:sugar transferase [Anaerolineae bacterium]